MAEGLHLPCLAEFTLVDTALALRMKLFAFSCLSCGIFDDGYGIGLERGVCLFLSGGISFDG